VTSELIFELYSCTGLTYCIDAIMSFYENSCEVPLWRQYNTECSFRSDGLVLSFNTASTSVIPVLNGKGILSHAKRYICHSPFNLTNLTHSNVIQDTVGQLPSVRLPLEINPAQIPQLPNTCNNSSDKRNPFQFYSPLNFTHYYIVDASEPV